MVFIEFSEVVVLAYSGRVATVPFNIELSSSLNTSSTTVTALNKKNKKKKHNEYKIPA